MNKKLKLCPFFHTQESLSHEEAVESGSQEVAGPSSLPESQVPPLSLPQKRARMSSNLKEAAIGLFLKATAALRNPPVFKRTMPT
ncbi:hypothetical protein AB205_0053790 [Aquarana catesbeiana]|uniref:Uncharacterized protein n=1 Tax=Aquarana catesbeiana TaxID=8400 RepID=A0A2G9RR27_AQUCT|nr:hypothetical protein AB205_0053790 [Aquarana catesbeiana]